MGSGAAVEHISQLANEIFWSKVRRARETPPVEKLLSGPRLFDSVCRVMRDGIRMQNPGADEIEVERILQERLEINRRIERRR